MAEQIDNPTHYTGGQLETIDKITAVIEGLPSEEAYLLGQIIRYVDRCESKHDNPFQDLGKANNYAHKLVTGSWRNCAQPSAAGKLRSFFERKLRNAKIRRNAEARTHGESLQHQ